MSDKYIYVGEKFITNDERVGEMMNAIAEGNATFIMRDVTGLLDFASPIVKGAKDVVCLFNLDKNDVSYFNFVKKENLEAEKAKTSTQHYKVSNAIISFDLDDFEERTEFVNYGLPTNRKEKYVEAMNIYLENAKKECDQVIEGFRRNPPRLNRRDSYIYYKRKLKRGEK